MKISWQACESAAINTHIFLVGKKKIKDKKNYSVVKLNSLGKVTLLPSWEARF